MVRLLSDGFADAVGLARPLALETGLPARLLAGGAVDAAAAAAAPRLRQLHDIWYIAQMWRMADGRDPEPRLTTVGALRERFVGRSQAHARLGEVGSSVRGEELRSK